MKALSSFVENRYFQGLVLAVICINAVLFGLQTSASVSAVCGPWLSRLDGVCLAVFTVELALKLVAYNRRFCSDPWNIFDFVVVAVSFVPDMGMFSSVRLFRVLRVFKLISGVRQMRVILTAIIRSIPGIMWAGALLGLIYYVYGILGTNLFGKTFPDWFGTLGKSIYSLFQVMTLESWSMGIARPVMEAFPQAWIFFVSYILLSSFIVMNIVVGIVLNSIGDSFKKVDGVTPARPDLKRELDKLKEQIAAVEAAIDAESSRKDTER